MHNGVSATSAWPTSEEPPQPWIYLIVATGDIREDVVQAQAAAARAPTSSP